MLKARTRKIPNTHFTLGLAIMAIGGGMFQITREFPWERVFAVSSAFVFCGGLLLFFSGCFEIYRSCRMVEKWNNNLIEKAFESAPPNSKIRILQTWVPAYERFWPFVEGLLKEKRKEFHFEILLINMGESDSPCGDLLDARILLRKQSRRQARASIEGNVVYLMNMKRDVDRIWREKHPGRQLDLKIRFYRFMPFGPIFQIGNSYLFVGFYLNQESSECAPMLVLRDPKSPIWRIFEQDFMHGWEQRAQNVCFADGKVVSEEIVEPKEKKERS